MGGGVVCFGRRSVRALSPSPDRAAAVACLTLAIQMLPVDGAYHLSQACLARSSAGRGGWYVRRDHRPFGIGGATCVAQSIAPILAARHLGPGHDRTPVVFANARESQPAGSRNLYRQPTDMARSFVGRPFRGSLLDRYNGPLQISRLRRWPPRRAWRGNVQRWFLTARQPPSGASACGPVLPKRGPSQGQISPPPLPDYGGQSPGAGW